MSKKYQLDTQSSLVAAERKGRQEGLKEGKQEIIDLLKSGKSPEEIIQEISMNTGIYQKKRATNIAMNGTAKTAGR